MNQEFNVLLDPLPEEWEGYPIDSDFQTGIQMFSILQDGSLSELEKIAVCADFLFPAGGPRSFEQRQQAILWFLSGWNTDNLPKGKAESPKVDYQADQWRIWVAFLRQYRIDLNRDQLHFWAFMALLRNLDECSFTRVVDIRSKKLTAKMSKEEREAYAQAKAMYSLKKATPNDYTEEERAKIDAFEERKRKAAQKKKARQAFEEFKR